MIDYVTIAGLAAPAALVDAAYWKYGAEEVKEALTNKGHRRVDLLAAERDNLTTWRNRLRAIVGAHFACSLLLVVPAAIAFFSIDSSKSVDWSKVTTALLAAAAVWAGVMLVAQHNKVATKLAGVTESHRQAVQAAQPAPPANPTPNP